MNKYKILKIISETSKSIIMILIFLFIFCFIIDDIRINFIWEIIYFMSGVVYASVYLIKLGIDLK